ncbi:TetR/AcrR family transcriptional regulator [Aliikangiella marina]|uniref:TetR/AcrR family transcriptional regulator n=1 Tax=Aliikangiella marina TaxID=1712262 RepID=A0A545TCJ9_9GAMM|nr:TetR/AcrR family transcriptional regulator [Aliikangiella marina]TQV74947.1 TetR/AcrR family transcriptional regulator [Aliikangiella marina]
MNKSQSKRVKILNSAKQLFLEQGYKSTSIQSIATEAGISKGAVYLYFKSKESILLSIFRMLEDKVWQQIKAIDSDSSLSPREKYRRHILTFHNEVTENLQFNQMMLSESGVELNEAFFNYAREYRYKLQKVQEATLLSIYGEQLLPWLSDVVISVGGIMQEFDTSIVLDNLTFDSEELADYIVHVTDFIVAGVVKAKTKPLFKEENIQIREAFLEKLKDDKLVAIEESMDEIARLCEETITTKENQQMLQETITMIKDALLEESLNKTLLKGLLNNLDLSPELKSAKFEFAELIGLKLN